MERDFIKGKVASLLNEKELVINIGSNSGVEVDMIFAILAESPLKITDPDTGEELGGVDREKVRVKVKEVQEKLSVCSTYKVYVIPGKRGALSTGLLTSKEMMESFYGYPEQRIQETLKLADSSAPPPLSPEESYVKIGDRVVEVEE